MRIGVPNEVGGDETRVSIAPETVKKLLASSHEVVVQAGAGSGAHYTDASYKDAGAEIASDASSVWGCDLVICVTPPSPEQVGAMKRGGVLMGSLSSTTQGDLVKALASAGVSSMAFEAVPRITRAQAMDVLSSMSTVAGYKAVLMAAVACPKFFPMMMTAAGTITASRALIIGAGVAGLQAIATARRLGAVVEAYDVRPAVKEQVLSLGARFVELDIATEDAETAGGYAKEQSKEQQQKQQQLMADHVASADCVVTTALIPGRPAPKLITTDMVERMRPGSVIVDLAAVAGGNCDLTKPGETVVHQGVSILGPTNLPAELPQHASQMYSRNALELIKEIAPEGELNLDLENEVISGALITHDGEVTHELTREALGMPALEPAGSGT